MIGPAFRTLALTASLLAIACEGRQVAVFELPTRSGVPGPGGTAGSDGAGSGGTADTVVGPSSSGSGGFASGAGGLGGGGASISFAGMVGTGGMAPTTCSSEADCMPGWVCNKQGCGSPTGLCVPWPIFCPPDPAPVCGCNGVTYWNDCIRLQSPDPTEFALPGPCSATACSCEIGTDCMVAYASCSHLLPPGEMCGHGMGACWVLPPKCAPSGDSKMWRECKPPDLGEVPQCLDTCNAIATEHSYAELHRGDTCN
jgi:hypothetical protein